MQVLSSVAATDAGWDFTSVWSPPNQVGQNGGSATAYYPQLYALSHVVAVAPDTSSVYGTTPIAQYHGLHASDFITTPATIRSEEHTSELQSLMRISYAVFCLKKKNTIHEKHTT